jgi:diguanylate cyclase (GGDEF)-like protein
MQELLERKKGLHRKVLIVDDEYIEREMLGAMLCDMYEVVYAENGALALDMIRRDKLTLSLVILDLHMPELDGYSLLKMIRGDSELRRIPIIVLTSEKEAEVKSLQLGAADFITKPYDAPDVIRARVSRSIELAEDSIIIHETERDSLTGLFNKEFFLEYGKRLDNQNDNMPMDAIVLDINRFHIVNELYGREYGDMILRKIGDFIHDLVRQTGGLACRSGSNSFGIYIPHVDDLKMLLSQYTARIDETMSDRKISVRIGIYYDDGSVTDIERRFDCARLACQKLRNSYSTCYDFYNAELHSKELHSERLITDMDKALEEKQFKVYFQPKYNIKGDRPVLASAEALVRWIHPEFGMVSPGEFISLFENNGLIHKLDRYVWSEAAAQIRCWKDKYGKTIPVSVNVSRVDIFDPMLGDILCEITNSNGLSPEDLLLEITESAYTDNSQQIVDTVSSLRDRGFKIEMDDFGCGYSSLNMLTSLPIDALKLDMKFIRNITVLRKDYELVKIMINIARLIEVPVIAEGVETKEQMEFLKAIDCDIIQGYYFSRPVPADEFDKLIEKEIEGDDHA